MHMRLHQIFRCISIGGILSSGTWPLHIANHRFSVVGRGKCDQSCLFNPSCGLADTFMQMHAGLRDAMLSPELISTPAEQSQARVVDFLDALQRHNIDSRTSLVAAWQKDSSILHAALKQWMRKGHAHILTQVWPKVHQEAVGVAVGRSDATNKTLV